MTTRRGFFWLCGGAGASALVAKIGVLALPPRMAQQRAGECTFCGKSRRELFALVGVPGGAVRICDECTTLFLVVLTEDPPNRYHPSLRRAACSFCQRPRAEVGRLLSGPRVFICDRCVDEAGRVMARGSSLRA